MAIAQSRAAEAAPWSPEQVRAAIARVPRLRLANIPTPLQYCPNLTRELGGPRVFIKRDDLTGLAFGGNKTRNLEFRMAEALAAGADTVVFGVEVTSNSARQTTAAANMLGLRTVLVLRGPADSEVQGNLLLDQLLGAEIHLIQGSNADMDRRMEELMDRLRAEGRRPFNLNTAPMFARASAIGYIESLLEIVDQLAAGEAFGGRLPASDAGGGLSGVARVPAGLHPTHIYMTSGSKGQAGLVLGRRALGLAARIVGIAASPPKEDRAAATARIANEAAETLGMPFRISPGEVVNHSDYVGDGYGVPTQECIAAIRLLARTEGVFLDPVYSGKGMAGLIDHVRRGLLGRDDVVVFVHTGGQPALFSHARALMA